MEGVQSGDGEKSTIEEMGKSTIEEMGAGGGEQLYGYKYTRGSVIQ